MRKGNWIWDTVWLWPVQCGVCAHSLPLVCASGRVVWFLGGAHILSWLLTNFFFFFFHLYCVEIVFLAPTHQGAKLVQLAAPWTKIITYIWKHPQKEVRGNENKNAWTLRHFQTGSEHPADMLSGPSPLLHMLGAVFADVIRISPVPWSPEGGSLLNCFSLCCFGSPPTWGRLLHSMSL